MLRVGTRGSPLALAQTAQVIAALERLGERCEIVTIRTHGDRHPESPTSALGVGAFVKDIEAALADEHIDVAVHSAKDLHSQDIEGLMIAAVLPRDDPLDVLVSRNGATISSLPTGAVVGTGSPRRRAFLLAARRDLLVRGIRGNVDTRLRKLDAGEVDGLVLAAAGLHRLGIDDRPVQRFDPSIMLPAIGQGVIALQARAGDGALRDQLAALDDPPTRAAYEGERAFVNALGGNCQTAIAALGICAEGRLILEGAVLDPEGTRVVRDRVTGAAKHADEVGRTLGSRLLEKGAQHLLAGVAS
ncbi:MAG TPA: hydroxymethylbilane synthase [bacterium]|nr:hydroxymethylbilane synthase [bacterium]